jgi:hypothetical protein
MCASALQGHNPTCSTLTFGSRIHEQARPMTYIVVFLSLLLAFIWMRWLASRLAWVWVHLVQQPAAVLFRRRSRNAGETAVNAAVLLAPIALIALLTLYAAIWGSQHFATISTRVAHSLGQRHQPKAAGATATAPIGRGSAARDAKTALRNTSTWAGRQTRSAAGKGGGGISGGAPPGEPSSPAATPAAAPAAPAAATRCASRAACLAESNALAAWQRCAPLIERAAPPHRWATAAADMHFDAFSADNPQGSTITYSGNGMLTRGDDGLWHRRAYSCAFDTAGGRVVSAQLLPVTQRLGE